MVNIKSILVSAAILAAGSVVFANPAQAAECKVDPLNQGQLTLWNVGDESSNTVWYDDGTIDTKVVVSGDENCEKSVSVGIWQWPTEDGLPLSSQVLYKAVTKTFGPGEHTITVDVPNCYWQADVMEGTRATAADGTADYQIGDPSDPNSDRFLDVAYGGEGVCFADEKETPKSTDKPAASTVSTLPNTGAGSTMTAAISSAVGAVTAAGYSLVRKFKK